MSKSIYFKDLVQVRMTFTIENFGSIIIGVNPGGSRNLA